MNRYSLAAALALGLTLTACQNQPEEEPGGSSGDSVTPTAPEMASGDEVVSEGPTDDATPYAGTTGASENAASSGDVSGERAARANAARSNPSLSDTMQSGGSTDGQRPPKGSKVQRAD